MQRRRHVRLDHPGLGAATTQWLAYAHAVQSSPDRERFGKGAVEGVLGPGAANNSTLGGSLVTTVAFGVPASVSTAILMGAFFIQGLVPGPTMLAPAPRGPPGRDVGDGMDDRDRQRDHGGGLSPVHGAAGPHHPGPRRAARSPILTLVYIGAFAEKNVFQDLGIVLVFGALGLAMARLGWPRPPLLLGLVLGPLAENRLFLATDNYGAAWLLRPGVLLLLGIALVGVAVPLVRRRRRPGAASAEQLGASRPPARRHDGVQPGGRPAFLWALWQSRKFGVRAGLFPWAVTVPALFLAVAQLVRDLTGRRATGDERDSRRRAESPPAVVRRRTAEIAAWILGMFAAIWLVGFAGATFMMTLTYLRLGAGSGG